MSKILRLNLMYEPPPKTAEQIRREKYDAQSLAGCIQIMRERDPSWQREQATARTHGKTPVPMLSRVLHFTVIEIWAL
jgi:hypothetical protein